MSDFRTTALVPTETYTVTGAQDTFSVPYPFDDADELVVTFGDDTTPLDYEVTDPVTPDHDGFYTADAVITLDDPVEDGILTIQRATNLEQEAVFQGAGMIPRKVLNREIARIWMALQDHIARIEALDAQYIALADVVTEVELQSALGLAYDPVVFRQDGPWIDQPYKLMSATVKRDVRFPAASGWLATLLTAPAVGFTAQIWINSVLVGSMAAAASSTTIVVTMGSPIDADAGQLWEIICTSEDVSAAGFRCSVACTLLL